MTRWPTLIAAGLWLGSGAVAGLAEDARVAWLRANVIPLHSLDATRPGTSDLQPLRRLFAEVEMVLLGEATRGDGTTFEAKTRLVRFLHEELDFDVLIFECGLFDCHHAWQAVRTGREARAALGKALFPLYVESQSFQHLLELIDQYAESDDPLEIAGIDSQLGQQNVEALIGGLTKALEESGMSTQEIDDLEETWAVVRHLAAASYTSGTVPLPDDSTRRRVDGTLSLASDTLGGNEDLAATSSGLESSAFWRQVVANLRAAADLAWELGPWDPARSMDPAIHNLRDRQMADNLLWLRRHRYPGRRIIVWSLTLHLARNLDSLETGEIETRERFSRFDLLGQRLAEALEPDPYVVAFTAFQGRKGSIFQQPHGLLVPTRGSLEDLMGRTGFAAAFLDLERLSSLAGGKWLARPMIARPVSFKELRGSWPQNVDAFFYIRDLEAARRVPE